ncbi:MAG: glutathione S-transferase family protein [Pseudomonadota bacterium]
MYTLYGAEVSYFTGKARAYLDWADLPYEERLATRDVYKDVIVPRVGWPVIPVLIGPDEEVLQDTSDIIDALEARHLGLSVYPCDPAQRLAALLFELLGDEWLVIPAMHYRWRYNRDFAYREFGKISAPAATPEEQFEIGKANAVNFEGALPVLGVDDATGPAIEAAYLKLLKQLDAHFAEHLMLLGDRPSIGDFGLMGPLYAHQYRDPASGKIMKTEAPNVARWVERMRKPEPQSGEFLPDDEVPVTLLPILSDQFRDQFPVLASTAAALAEWAADKSPGEPVPRALGPHGFKIGDTQTDGNRMIFPFNLWMLQRPLDHYRGLEGDEKTAADRLLDACGGDALRAFPDFPRLERRNFKLVLA